MRQSVFALRGEASYNRIAAVAPVRLWKRRAVRLLWCQENGRVVLRYQKRVRFCLLYSLQ